MYTWCELTIRVVLGLPMVQLAGKEGVGWGGGGGIMGTTVWMARKVMR